MSTLETVKSKIQEHGIEVLFNSFPDANGLLCGKGMPAKKLQAIVESGSGFAGGSVVCSGHNQAHGDLICMPDLDTYFKFPWNPKWAAVLGTLYYEGKPHPQCPRGNLKRMCALAKSKGFIFNVGMELEFFLTETDENGRPRRWREKEDIKPLPGYGFGDLLPAVPFLSEVIQGMDVLGWNPYAFDHEDANSQYEIDMEYADALTTADRITIARTMIKQFAKKILNVGATFSPKPFPHLTGSGCHAHFSLADLTGKNNLFIDNSDSRGHGLSQLAYHFLGGVYKHAHALRAVEAPTMECYDRLRPDTVSAVASGISWIPAQVPTIGGNNRSCWVRVAEPGNCELRSVSGACNPYFILAALLGAGLDGIEKKLPCPEFCTGSAFEQKEGKRFPQTLDEALDELENDHVILDALGPVAQLYIAQKRQESRDWTIFKHGDTTPPSLAYFKSL